MATFSIYWVIPVTFNIHRLQQVINVMTFSGYPLKPWLMTPLRDVVPGTPEERLNSQLKTIRNGIERCNGVLKNRWRCLLKHRVLHYTPQMAAAIVKTCCVLHNMCIAANQPEPVIDFNGEPDTGHGQNVVEPDQNVDDDLLRARNIQTQLINNYFN